MTRFSVLLIERHRKQGGESYAIPLQKRYDIISVGSGRQALAQLNPTAIVLDALSLRTPGDRIAKQLKQDMSTVPLIHLRSVGRTDSPADIVLCPPFTARKLINAIERVLRNAAVDVPRDDILKCGLLEMNVTRRLLLVDGQETPLTPKLAALVEAFFRHPDQTLDRKWLMEHVWHTDYMGDTRTLDVHVRWIRRAIEQDVNAPRYLKTVRGIGYRLETPDEPRS